MPDPVSVDYWDSCVFLSLIDPDSPRRAEIRQCMDEASKGARRILTSTLTVTEVAFLSEERHSGLSSIGRNTINALWVPPSPVTLVNYHYGIATQARDLIRDGMASGKMLKPADAIHLASALSLGVTHFETYNIDDFRRWDGTGGIKVREPQALNSPLDFGDQR